MVKSFITSAHSSILIYHSNLPLNFNPRKWVGTVANYHGIFIALVPGTIKHFTNVINIAAPQTGVDLIKLFWCKFTYAFFVSYTILDLWKKHC
jgi:hypothetical protein